MSFAWTLASIAALSIAFGYALPAARANDVIVVSRQGPTGATRLREGGRTRTPFAFLRFCAESPSDCRTDTSRQIRWDRSARDVVVSTNARINRTIRPVGDLTETWTAGGPEGDCEDFALTKRRVLMREGLPASSLRMAVAVTSFGDQHAVLVVKTNVGDFILDNRTDEVLLSNRTDLRWIKIASAENPRIWHVVR